LSALRGCWRLNAKGRGRSLEDLCVCSALIFFGVGGAWVLADRVGFHPLDFPDAIVTLTAVHFHFAGLILPLIAGLTVRTLPSSRFASVASIGVVLGVPAVAIGITATQLGGSPSIEAVAGGVLAMSGIFIAILQVRIALRMRGRLVVQVLFMITGISLLFGMLLAGTYAFRSWFLPLPWLDVPWMRALHGTANALGFGLCGLLAWRAVSQQRDPAS
jgi:hypothetical protein